MTTVSGDSSQTIQASGSARVLQPSSLVTLGCSPGYKPTSNDMNGLSCVVVPESQSASAARAADSNNTTYIIVGVVVAGCVLIVIVIVAVIVVKMRSRRNMRKFMSSIDMSSFIPQFQKNTIINENELSSMVQVRDVTLYQLEFLFLWARHSREIHQLLLHSIIEYVKMSCRSTLTGCRSAEERLEWCTKRRGGHVTWQ